MPTHREYNPGFEEKAQHLKRARGRCQMCGRRGRKPGSKTSRKRGLTTHHVDDNSQNDAIWNLSVLCAECHLRLEGFNRRMRKRLIAEFREILDQALREVTGGENMRFARPDDVYTRANRIIDSRFTTRGDRRRPPAQRGKRRGPYVSTTETGRLL